MGKVERAMAGERQIDESRLTRLAAETGLTLGQVTAAIMRHNEQAGYGREPQ